MRSLYSSFLNLPYLLILELIIMLFFCKVYYAKFPPGMEQRRVLLMYPLLSKLWLNLHYINVLFLLLAYIFMNCTKGLQQVFWDPGFGLFRAGDSGF